ncbi:Ig-like domain-containing protein [Leadbettera azotonutricia]|uniref:Ig domain protein group 2 domain protein n=1 Tax=Leadbettera azotonutricia (strain ATCC BAA-888 / DSM 13862 / ZAS-9) TaxID=545695 RepID=F5Y932_LEAAZ|nr:Ig-like domain-containing protein [Leadbettera azotonutricia]AEF80891.1 Ig domain protein group 2 domain protein [Leadbettera azotonutricia ZAS-9]
MKKNLVVLVLAAAAVFLNSCLVLPYGVDYSEPTVSISAPTPAQIVEGEVYGVSIRPTQVAVRRQMTQQFTVDVAVTGDASKKVTWEVGGNTSAKTTINSNGLLTVGNDEKADTLIIRATSTFDRTKSATAKVII